MSEEIAASEESGGSSLPDTSGLAVDLALEEARKDPSLRSHVAAFLADQRGLIADQRHHMRIQLKQLRLGLWEKRMGVALRVATACVGVAVAAGLAFLVWDAAHANGLLIEPFSVPPEMAERGLTGDVLAGEMLARLIAMQESTDSNLPPKAYANNWGDNLKVEIPETGISVGEAYRFLRQWLGHDTRISGAVHRTATGIAVTARAEGSGASFTGADADLDALMQKAAEDVYGRTQPYRYAAFLRTIGRVDEAYVIWSRLSEEGSPLEQAWAWAGVSTTYTFRNQDYANAIAALRRAIAVYPDFTLGYSLLGIDETNLGHIEAGLAAFREAAKLFDRASIPDLDPSVVPSLKVRSNTSLARLQGDPAGAISLYRDGLALARPSAADHENFRQNIPLALLAQHDRAGALAYWRAMPPATALSRASRGRVQVRLDLLVAAERQEWKSIVAAEVEQKKTLFANTPPGTLSIDYARLFQPVYALAKAETGDRAGAAAELAAMPAGCHECMRAHADVAAALQEWPRADWWFARAVATAPSSPFAYEAWGRSLLERGDADAAIAKFTLANQKGPHFADALEGWGEALMASSRSHLALAKFAEAEKYAPNWGRLHLKWGEALSYAGKKDEAAKHFTRAAALDLTPSEKSELARQK